MAVMFLVGGTGNQFFQFSRAQEDDTFSTLFLHQKVRKLFGWTPHQTILEFPKPNAIFLFVALTFLIIDLALAKTLNLSMFTEFDLKSIKLKPKIKRVVAMGYFQSGAIIRNPQILSKSLLESIKIDTAYDIVIHIRGGDLAEISKSDESAYGYLSAEYYDKALSLAKPKSNITIVTDDIPFATEIIEKIHSNIKLNIINLPLDETMAICVKARVFISCNSTLSYWMIWLRSIRQDSYAPKPFFKRGDMKMPDHVKRINYTY